MKSEIIFISFVVIMLAGLTVLSVKREKVSAQTFDTCYTEFTVQGISQEAYNDFMQECFER